MADPLESLISLREEPDGRITIHPAEPQIERRNCPRCGWQMTPGHLANTPPREYWVCENCHEAESA